MKRKTRQRRKRPNLRKQIAIAGRFNALEPPWVRVRYVKFSPQEMAMDVPAETKEGKWIFCGRGRLAMGARPSDARYILLDPDVGKYFEDDRLVNETLRRAMWLMQVQKAIDLKESRARERCRGRKQTKQ